MFLRGDLYKFFICRHPTPLGLSVTRFLLYRSELWAPQRPTLSFYPVCPAQCLTLRRRVCLLNAQMYAHTGHCRNIFRLCLSSWSQQTAPGAQGTCPTKTVCGVETCEGQVGRASRIWTAGQGPARGGVGLSHRRARLEFFSGIYYPQ